MNFTFEQKDILKTISRFDKNLHINAIPGSAKTTTCLQIARDNPLKRILLLTYNKRLRKETLQRLEGLKNIDVHTFHSFGYNGFQEKSCKNDIGLQNICVTDEHDVSFCYDLLIIDEAQDLTLLLYRFVKKCYSYFIWKCPIIVVGDSRQCIFSYKGADERFLSLASTIFQWNSYPWIQKTLSVTFRCTPFICNFINSCLSSSDTLLTSGRKNSPNTKPFYVFCDIFFPIKIVQLIERVIYEEHASLHDILILFPSIRNTCKQNSKEPPVIKLCNMLSNRGFNICVQFDHTIDIDEEILQDKIWISNFHKIKGIERKHVFVFNFDSSYFNYYGRNLQNTILPNILYVALSRASCSLYVINHKNNAPFNFINKESIRTYCTYDDRELNSSYNTKQKSTEQYEDTDPIFPSTFSQHVNTILLSTCIAELSMQRYDRQRPLCFASKTVREKHGSIENVSDINSEIINILLQRSSGNICNLEKLFRETKVWLFQHNLCHDRYVLNDYETYDFADTSAVTYLATAIVSYKNKLIFRLKQLHTYDWFSRNMIDKTYHYLEAFIERCVEIPFYEEHVEIRDTHFNRSFFGYIDCYDIQTDTVYEFKCTNIIDDKHIIQTLVYRYMMDLMIPDTCYGMKTSYIYNMKTNECVEITASHGTIKSIIERILQSKNNDGSYFQNNNDFIRSCNE